MYGLDVISNPLVLFQWCLNSSNNFETKHILRNCSRAYSIYLSRPKILIYVYVVLLIYAEKSNMPALLSSIIYHHVNHHRGCSLNYLKVPNNLPPKFLNSNAKIPTLSHELCTCVVNSSIHPIRPTSHHSNPFPLPIAPPFHNPFHHTN